MHPPSRRALLVLLVAALILLTLSAVVLLAPTAAAAIDLPAHEWFLSHRSSPLTYLAVTLTDTGTSAFVSPVVVVVGLLTGFGGPRPRLVHTGLMFVVVLSGVLCRTGLSVLIARARPPAVDWATAAAGFSFPSGHSADGVLVAGLVGWAILRRIPLRPALRAGVSTVVIAYAAALGITRVYLGVHWPLDVLGGWTFGVLWLSGAALLNARYRVWSRNPTPPTASSSGSASNVVDAEPGPLGPAEPGS